MTGDSMDAPRLPDDAAAGPDVVVAVLTYRRPECLARIAPALLDQASLLSPPATVLVVDNDPAGGAAQWFAHWAATGPVTSAAPAAVRYVHEPRPGISAARNRALDEAAQAAALVFIDDDEMPSARWLPTIVDAWRSWRCDAVSGPVVAEFETPPGPWLVASGAFDRRAHHDGDVVGGGATNNLLLDMGTVGRQRLRFDEGLGLVGGEDTMFSHQLVARGGIIRWCEAAVVAEPISPERLNRRWVLRRSYRAGSSWSRTELALAGSSSRRTVRRTHLAARGIVKLATGGLLVLAGVLGGDVGRRARGAVQASSYAGLLMGAFGFTLQEYSRRQVRPGQQRKTKLFT